MTLSGMKEIPADSILEVLYRTQVEKSTQIKGPLDLYNRDAIYKGEQKSYKTLFALVDKHIESTRKKPKHANIKRH